MAAVEDSLSGVEFCLRPWLKSREARVKSKYYVFTLHWQCPVSSSAIHCPSMPANRALRSFCCRFSIRPSLNLKMFQAQDFDWFEWISALFENAEMTSSICCLVLACRVLKQPLNLIKQVFRTCQNPEEWLRTRPRLPACESPDGKPKCFCKWCHCPV